MNEPLSAPSYEASDATNEPTPLRANLFSALVAQLVGEIATTQNFQDSLAIHLEGRLDSMADDLAQEMCDAITQNIDVDDIVTNSGALSSLEERLGVKLQELVDDINI